MKERPEGFTIIKQPVARTKWWPDIIEGLPDPIGKDGFIDVWDSPRLGVSFNAAEAKKHLCEEDAGFFD